MQLSRNHLAAALEAAGTKDVRYYLNGVYVERFACGRIQYTGTNGHILFTCWDDTDREAGDSQYEPYSLIMPHDVCKELAKLKSVRPETPVSGRQPQRRGPGRAGVSPAQRDEEADSVVLNG